MTMLLYLSSQAASSLAGQTRTCGERGVSHQSLKVLIDLVTNGRAVSFFGMLLIERGASTNVCVSERNSHFHSGSFCICHQIVTSCGAYVTGDG